jgi:serine/threonine protein phosphatase PrpC
MEPNAFFRTDVGRRPQNEDWYGIESDVGLFAVADGMGGYEGGEIASQVAVDALKGFYQEMAARPSGDRDEALLQRGLMSEAFGLANHAVRNLRRGKLAKMGCTLSALVIRGERALIGHMGDSRVYRLRSGPGEALRQLTADHSLVAAMQAAGIDSVVIHTRLGHIITRAIGVHEVSDPDISVEAVEPGDRYLLCTDGLTDVVSDARLAAVLRDEAAEAVCPTLIAEALRAGSQDNVTALLVEIGDRRDSGGIACRVDGAPEETSPSFADRR